MKKTSLPAVKKSFQKSLNLWLNPPDYPHLLSTSLPAGKKSLIYCKKVCQNLMNLADLHHSITARDLFRGIIFYFVCLKIEKIGYLKSNCHFSRTSVWLENFKMILFTNKHHCDLTSVKVRHNPWTWTSAQTNRQAMPLNLRN